MRSKKIVAFILAFVMITICIPVNTRADLDTKKNYKMIVDGSEVGDIAVLDVNYENNVYMSISNLAYYLRNTNKAFNVEIKADEINIRTNEQCNLEPYSFNDEEYMQSTRWNLARTKMYVNDIERKYYSIIGDVSEDRKDAFFRPLNISMFLNIDIDVDNNSISIDTGKDFYISGEDLSESGYLQGVNSMLCGDGSTGQVFFEYNSDKAVPIASTTKLMTYFVLMDAVSNGEVSLEDIVPISSRAVMISQSIDGVIPLGNISEAPIGELMDGMLLSSSNECALAIAEHVAGSEDEFVNRMNKKAEELLMSTAKFYNCNGLPIYNQQFISAKMQNNMSAYDMFILISELVKSYPEILEITSTKVANLSKLGFESKNTNALLYNMSEVKGLKTGTTNKSGACLTICMPVEKDGNIHNLICVLFGAESEVERATIAEIGSRIALFELAGAKDVDTEIYKITPENPEIDVKRMLKHLK